MTPAKSPTLSVFDPVTRCEMAFAGPDADRTVVWLEGEHDISTVSTLSATLARAIASDDADLVVDLSGVQFIGAATADVFTRAHEYLQLKSRSLALRSPSSSSLLVLELCGLVDLCDPGSAHPTAMTGATSALGTWVEVPVIPRVDRCADASPSERGADENSDSARTVPAEAMELVGRESP